jgi:hypothetical protein
MAKYGNKKTVVDGITFDSKREAARYQELKLLQKAGEISGLELQPKYGLLPKFIKNGKTHKAITYIADFTYCEGDKRIVEDVKGMETEVFKIKRKMFEYYYPGAELRVVR